MQTVERHGGGSHFVRPDRVYRTGVLSSTMGYQPGADVQSVAASFTQYPMDLSLPSGLGAVGVGVIEKLRLRFMAWKSRKKAKAFMQGPPMVAQTAAFMPGGAYAQVGEQYSPQMLMKEQMVALLTQGTLSPEYAQAQAQTSLNHWNNRWWNG